MRHLKYLVLLAVLALPAVYSQAQVSIGVRIGPDYGYYNAPPVCAYGFYPDYPFACAPYGYWGPEWFVDGVFIGAGPWYHFYYIHPEFYRHGYYSGRSYGYWGGFRGDDHRFRGDDRRFRDGDRFRERGREFHDNGGGRFRDGGGGRFRDGGGRGFREDNGGGNRGGGRGREFHGDRGGGNHFGRGNRGGGRGDHDDGNSHGGRR